MKKIFTKLLLINIFCLIALNFNNIVTAGEPDIFVKDKFECHVIANSECYANLITKYQDSVILKNILTYDYGFALAREKDYTNAIKKYKYVIENEKEIQDLINVANKQLNITNEIVKNKKIAQKQDKGNYYNSKIIERWAKPDDLRFYIETNTGKEYLFKNAVNIYNKTFKGKIKLINVNNPKDANIKVSFVDYISDNKWAVSSKGYDDKKNIVNADIKIALKRDKTFHNPDIILEVISLNIIGETLGLPESDNKNDIMFKDAYKCYRKDDFSKRDKNTLLKLYSR